MIPWALLTLVLAGLLAAAFHAGRMYERDTDPTSEWDQQRAALQRACQPPNVMPRRRA